MRLNWANEREMKMKMKMKWHRIEIEFFRSLSLPLSKIEVMKLKRLYHENVYFSELFLFLVVFLENEYSVANLSLAFR